MKLDGNLDKKAENKDGAFYCSFSVIKEVDQQ